MSIGTHIVIALVDRRVIAADPHTRRHYARIVTRIGAKYGLVAHGLPDEHGHLAALCDRATAGVCVQAIETSLSRCLHIPVPFRAAYFKPIDSQSHLRSVIPYIHNQCAHHGVDIDPYFDASSLPDLVGARLIGGGHMRERLAAAAPRIKPVQHLPDALRHAQCLTITIEQAAVAAAAAIGHASLSGASPVMRAARQAALAVAAPASRKRRAAALSCCPRTVSRLLREPPPIVLVAATRMQADWRFGSSRRAVGPLATRARTPDSARWSSDRR